MPTLVIRNPDGSEQEQELVEQISIGRAEGNDLILTEGGVSRKHARFTLEGRDVVVSDEGSANGTFVDGEKIAGPTKLGARAVVVIGDYEVTVRGPARAGAKPSSAAGAKKPSPEDKDRATARNASVKGPPPRATKMVEVVKPDPAASAALVRKPRPGGASPTGPVLRGLTGPWLNRTFPLRGTMTVGRVAGVDIQIEDDSVSRRHAEVVVQGNKEVVLRDLGSANGTTLNGAPLAEEVTLTNGDIIQFGVVEVTYEDGAPAKLARGAPVPRAGGKKGPTGPTEAELAAAVGGGGSKKGLVVGGALVAVVLLVGALVKVSGGDPPPVVGPTPPPTGTSGLGGSIEDYLSQCRQYSSVDVGEPDWSRAAEACEKVLVEEPIHPEANLLMKKIRTEQRCEENFIKGKKSMSRQRDEEAIDAFAKIGKDCSYFYKVKPLIQDAVAGAKKRSGEECTRYFNDQKWDNAADRCARYMQFHCQNLTAAELYPPATMTLNASTGPLRKGQWRPKDEMYLKLLRSRERVDPGAAPWVCPPMAIIDSGKPVEGPDPIAEEFKRRYRDPDLAAAVLLYFKGKSSEAEKILLKLRETREKAEFHKQAEDLLRDMATVKQALNDGSSDLRDNDPEKAADALREALEVDEIIVNGGKPTGTEDERRAQLDKLKSDTRRNIQQEMAAASYQRGRGFMERQDPKHACKVWKLGYSFWRGNSDLLKALTNVCTQKADENLKAGNCESLKRALEFAVPGDGVAEKVPERKAELKCP